MHIGVVALTTYLLLADWDNWEVPVIITITHLIIDLAKTYFRKDTTTAFVLDQVAHIGVIFIVWLGMTGHWEEGWLFIDYVFKDDKVWLVILGYLINTLPLAVLIRYLTGRWSTELVKEADTEEIATTSTNLKDAGKWIGILERLLIFTFILFNELRAIGFLLAAKSVFRFGDLKDSADRKKTEYILIGTLISFASSIIVGLVIVNFLR